MSESQERMTVAIRPDDEKRFMALSEKHAVESTVIGTYTDSGKLHITYNDTPCAYVNMDLLTRGFPQWVFEAEWTDPEDRGLYEPVLSEPADYATLLCDMMARPNICAKEWIARQYDHEVQGGSVIKPLVGRYRDVNSDAAVLRPVLTSEKGLVFSQAVIPFYSAIDAWHMTACTIDEAVRRLLAVGGNFDHIGGVDNFCWPNIQYDPAKNPDGKFKAAQLVRSCRAMAALCGQWEIPLLSGKDSMYVDGHLPGAYGEHHKVSALETLQFSVTGVIEDIKKCVTMDVKTPGDLVYILGETRNELGASEYYERFGYIGRNVPRVDAVSFIPLYKAVNRMVNEALAASIHGIYRGGMAVHLALCAMGGDLGISLDLSRVPAAGKLSNDTLLFSESAGRFIVTVRPENKDAFEAVFKGLPCACAGRVTEERVLDISAIDSAPLCSVPVDDLRYAWKKPFGDLL